MADETTTAQDSGKTGGDGKSGTSELDRLLAEYSEKKPASPPPADAAKVVEAMRPIAQYAETKMREEQEQAVRKSVDEAVNFIQTDEALKLFPKKVVQGYLQTLYSEDTAFKAAYDNRGRDQQAWNSALSKAQSSFKEEMKGFQSSNRSDVEAAKAAVQGARSTPSANTVDPAKLRKMSDTEFSAFKAEQAAANRRRA